MNQSFHLDVGCRAADPADRKDPIALEQVPLGDILSGRVQITQAL
jgi:hypothetical protein